MRENTEALSIDPLLRAHSIDTTDRVEELYRRHQDRLRGLAASVMLDWSMADEVVQEAFAGLTGRIDDVVNPEGYLQRSVINLALRVVKRRARSVPARPIQPSTIPEIDEMWSIVAGLPAPQRAVLVLRFWEDLTQEQIADALEIPLGTVKSTLHRALRAVRVQLEVQEDR